MAFSEFSSERGDSQSCGAKSAVDDISGSVEGAGGDGLSILTDQNNNQKSKESYRLGCGWWSFRPKCLQRFLSAKWALFWLCWAGAVQGND